ncbi:MAG: GAF domain-containing protein [Candidatus Electrothrix aestuarii]|uniref:GAF domain-containing protein n=1 Tax=Candidatus Electrothrix aestuarii TaxID=3062594 RepID=A0AAU8M2V7_9BACT|nr:GAF domain-containing protein [Candidatus Electrothrix aestuarii]
MLDTTPEQAFDDITLLASFICETPISLITLLDETRQWFKAKVGLAVSETPREVAFCNHALNQSEMLIIEDARRDERFSGNPLVTGDPNIRFYAGSQLVTPDGYPLGTLCVIDQKPRELSPDQLQALEALSRQVISQLELRRASSELQQANTKQEALIAELQEALSLIETLEGMIPICAHCKKIRDDKGYWHQVEVYISQLSSADFDFSHGICPDCMQTLYPEFHEPEERS